MTTLILLLAIGTIQAPSARTAPAGWRQAADTMSTLLRDGKCPEAIAIGEQWVAKHPAFADAHVMLGAAHENIARGFCANASGAPRPDRAERTKQFETAATHLRHGFELGGGESPFVAIRALVDIYGFIALDRPGEQEKIAREAVVRYPAEPVAHVELISALLRRDAEPDAAKAATAARAALPKTAGPRFEMANSLAFRATGTDPVSKLTFTRESRAAMGRIALGMLDDVLAINPTHKEAQRAKAELLQAQKELPNEPPLSAARPPADEPGVRSTLRAIMSAQVTYSAVCGGGFYAPTLAALAKPRTGEQFGFLSSSDVPPGGAKFLEKNRYAIEMTAPPSPKSPAGCNGVPAGQSAQAWSATARPLPGYSGKSYKIDAEGALTEIK